VNLRVRVGRRLSAADVQSGVALKLPTHQMVRRDVEKGIKKV
jgi:hypothetical protein